MSSSRSDWSALDLAASRGAAVQLTVIHRGHTVLDDSVRCTPDALGWLFSAGKPFTSLLIHRLAATGALDLDEPIAHHWPAFGAGGAGTKAATTVRDVLCHRTGIPTAGPYVRAVLSMQDPEASVRRVASARRRPRPGAPARGSRGPYWLPLWSGARTRPWSGSSREMNSR